MADINQLINEISPDNITNYFQSKISSFRPEKEDLRDLLPEEDERKFTELTKHDAVELADHDELVVFSCNYDGELSSRSSKKKQYDIAKKILKYEFKDAAIFIFYDNFAKFCVSFIRTNYSGAKRDYSTWKRYTYFIDPEKPPNAHFFNA